MLINLFYAIRPKTLIIAIAVILLGQTLAWYDLMVSNKEPLNPYIVFFCLSCCIFLQIAVNLANDYFDHLSGVDGPNRVGPKRIVQNQTFSLATLKQLTLLFTLLAIACGSVLIWIGGWVFFLLGLLSLLGVYLYSGSQYSLASRSLGEVAVFLFFGWLGVMGSYYLQVKEFHWGLLVPATEIGLLVAAVMLVNNIRDISSDHTAGKITLAFRLGPVNSRWLYALLLLIPFVLLPFNPYLPWLNSVLLPLHLGLCVLIRKRSGSQLNTQLGQTSSLVLLWALGYLASYYLSPVI